MTLIDELRAIEPDENTRKAYRNSGVWRNRTIAEDAEHLAKKEPDKVLWVEGDNRLTAGDAYGKARKVAAGLYHRGLRPGDVVSFQLPNWTEAVILDIACVMLGLVVNPIVPIYRNAELELILKDCGARALFIPEAFRSVDHADMVDALRPNLPDLQDVIVVRGTHRDGMSSFDDLLATTDTDIPWPDQRPEAVKMIMYTSGTTGRPKGVLHSHETMARAMHACFDHWRIQTDDWVLMPSPVTHVTGFSYGIEWPLVVGTRTILMQQWDAARATELIDQNNVVATVGATPFLAELISAAETAGSRLESLRVFGCGGAAVPPALIRKANTTFANTCAFRIFGSTEVPVVTLGYLGDDTADLAADTDGEIIDYEVRIVDDHGNDGAEEGEILVRGPSQYLGYLSPQDRIGAEDEQGFFRTGDIGSFVSGKGLVITGRKKDLIIRGGENLSAKEIEDVLHTHEAIKEAAVVAMPHKRLGETVCAFVIPSGLNQPDVASLADFLDGRGLARQKFPECVRYVTDLPRTASGKVRKDLLRKEITEYVPSAAKGA